MNNYFEKVNIVLNNSDPIKIAKYNSSGIEYEKEAREISVILKDNYLISVEELSPMVQKIFENSFQKGIDNNGKLIHDKSFNIGEAEIYNEIAKKILIEIKKII